MLVTHSRHERTNFWCFDESVKVYIHSTLTRRVRTSAAYNLSELSELGKINILGAVCLGFWRG